MRDKYFICHFKGAAVLFGPRSIQCYNTMVPRREKKVACCWSLPNSINKSVYNNSLGCFWMCACVCEMLIRWQNKHSQHVLSSFCIAWHFSYIVIILVMYAVIIRNINEFEWHIHIAQTLTFVTYVMYVCVWTNEQINSVKAD